jgi:hypothetical protein
LLESFLKPSLSSQAPQASVVNEPAESGELLRHHKPKNPLFADTGPSKGMHIELRAEGIP